MIGNKGDLYFIDFGLGQPIGSEKYVMGTYWYNSIEKSLIHHINVKHPASGYIEYRIIRF